MASLSSPFMHMKFTLLSLSTIRALYYALRRSFPLVAEFRQDFFNSVCVLRRGVPVKTQPGKDPQFHPRRQRPANETAGRF